MVDPKRRNYRGEIILVAREMGIDKVGFTSKERLGATPPSGNLAGVLPNARSAISLVVAFDRPAMRAFLAKEDQLAHCKDQSLAYKKLKDASIAIANLLKERGHEAASPFANF